MVKDKAARLAEKLMLHVIRGAHRGAGVARRWMNVDVPKTGARQDLAVESGYSARPHRRGTGCRLGPWSAATSWGPG